MDKFEKEVIKRFENFNSLSNNEFISMTGEFIRGMVKK
jgi:hypothetical protein